MLFIKLVLMVVSTFFIAMDYDRLTAFCMRQLNGWARDIFLQVKQYVVGTLFVCIRSYALIMSITFAELFFRFYPIPDRFRITARTLHCGLRYSSGTWHRRHYDSLGCDHGNPWRLSYGLKTDRSLHIYHHCPQHHRA